MGKHLTDDEINMNLNNCKTSGRWIILQGLHNQLENLYRMKFPKTSEKFMICATIPRGVALPEFILSQFRLQVSLKSFTHGKTVFPQNIDLPETTFERIEALIYLVAEEQKFEDQLKKVFSLAFQFTPFTRWAISPSWPVSFSSTWRSLSLTTRMIIPTLSSDFFLTHSRSSWEGTSTPATNTWPEWLPSYIRWLYICQCFYQNSSSGWRPFCSGWDRQDSFSGWVLLKKFDQCKLVLHYRWDGGWVIQGIHWLQPIDCVKLGEAMGHGGEHRDWEVPEEDQWALHDLGQRSGRQVKHNWKHWLETSCQAVKTTPLMPIKWKWKTGTN